MAHRTLTPPRRAHGTSLIEVLVTMVVLAFGLLGLAVFQVKAQVGSVESYQRAQAAVLLQDMQSRLTANGDNADAYLTTHALGTNDTPAADCDALTSRAERDKCEWSHALQGAAEKTRSNSQVGAVSGARGCITRVRARNTAVGVCTPAVYLVTVAWQGLHPTKAPAQDCGRGEYGPETNRRAMSARVAVGLPNCF
ncbi:type IV pilus modification PilV family protein [Massilia horti]|uniref:Type IV pilus modification protein PilV n=1 Tax=Massilia horti TaxID=2562153 RepID=A0A4Y9T5B8_9BURK|nr:prepilin-type N-terminal cleavage/methylation domain-containing protein [Massilia horti]TFW33151.1 type IV pilus modification protein PilV [Massilia horti]